MADTRTRSPRDIDDTTSDNDSSDSTARASLQKDSERGRNALVTDRLAASLPLPTGFPQLEVKAEKPPLMLEVKADKADSPREIKRADGTYTRDAEGRVTLTVSPDGSFKREFKYEDPANPKRVTSLTINGDTTYKYSGAVTSDGKPAMEGGHEVSAYTVTKGGRELGTWNGVLDMSRNGVYSVKTKGADGPLNREGADGKIAEADAKAREERGIWVTAETPDNRKPSDNKTGATIPGAKPVLEDGKSAIKRASSDKPAGEPAGTDGAVKRADFKADDATAISANKVKLDDGTYERDDKGRITSMVSPDGKNKRTFKYEDASNPDRVTSVTINDKTEFKNLGPVTSNGVPMKDGGLEVNSWSAYENGQLKGGWHGVIDMSKNGVYSVKSMDEQGAITREGATGKITEEQATARNRDGIWPSKFESEHKDGTKYIADFKGKSLDTLKEVRTVDGNTVETVWRKQGDGYVSNETPPREKAGVEMRSDGSVAFTDKAGSTEIKHKDGTRDIKESGVTRSYDDAGRLAKITQANGESRVFGYKDSELSSITNVTANGRSTWTKNGDEWSNGDRTEVRKNVKTNNDGSIEYDLASGNKVRETKDFSKVEMDDKGRAVRVEFASGATRKFEYNGDKLQSVTDSLKVAGKQVDRNFVRQGDSNTFVDQNDPKKRERTISGAPSADGDYKYSGKDGKERVARARDLERQTRGEGGFGGSESFQDAKDDLLQEVERKGIDAKRFEGWVNEFQANATKYKLTEEQLTKTLDNLRETLSTAKSPLYDEANLKKAVETAMHNIARPMEIDQGAHPTCNVTTLEVYAAARHPEQYSRLIKEIATTGKYRTTDGKVVTPPTNALKPGEDEAAYDLSKPNTEKRNLASQIVQMTLINGLYETGGVKRYQNGQMVPQTETRYVMDKSYWKPYGPNSQIKVGEDRLADRTGRPTEQSDSGPGFTQGEILNASKMALGYEMPYIKAPTSMDGGRTWNHDYPTAERLAEAKRDGKFPMGIATLGGMHVQTIHDVKTDSRGQCWVLLDNQHGEKCDGWTPLAEVHRTQGDPNYEVKPTIRRWQQPAN